MKMVKYYLAIATLFLIWSAATPYVWLKPIVAWVGLSVLVVSLAYILDKPSIFRKREDGTIPTYIRWVFMPFLMGASIYNWFARRYDKVPPIQQVTEKVYLACRLFPNDIEYLKSQGVTGILDVTAEFDGLDWSTTDANLAYLNIPVLDHKSPSETQLRKAIGWIQQQIDRQGKVVVHCALGRGRSVFVTAAYLLSRDRSLNVLDAMNQVQSARQTARLNKRQLKALKNIREQGGFSMATRIGLVVNPVSGGGKWAKEKGYILERLSEKFDVSIKETTRDIDARELARALVDDGIELIVACGGDGTLAEVADVVIRADKTMGVIPLGTANALSMVLFGSSSKVMPISTACDLLLAQNTCKMDTVVCNGVRTLLVCGIGVEAEMIKRSDRAEKDEKGQLAYLQFFTESMLTAQPVRLSIQLDDKPAQALDIQSLVVANAAPPSTVLAQGGGNPDVFDGLLDVSWFERHDNLIQKVSSLIGLTMSGLLDGKHSDGVAFKRARQVVIEAEGTIDYVLDGEVFSDKRIVLETQPKSLSVVCSEAFAD